MELPHYPSLTDCGEAPEMDTKGACREKKSRLSKLCLTYVPLVFFQLLYLAFSESSMKTFTFFLVVLNFCSTKTGNGFGFFCGEVTCNYYVRFTKASINMCEITHLQAHDCRHFNVITRITDTQVSIMAISLGRQHWHRKSCIPCLHF